MITVIKLNPFWHLVLLTQYALKYCLIRSVFFGEALVSFLLILVLLIHITRHVLRAKYYLSCLINLSLLLSHRRTRRFGVSRTLNYSGKFTYWTIFQLLRLDMLVMQQWITTPLCSWGVIQESLLNQFALTLYWFLRRLNGTQAFVRHWGLSFLCFSLATGNRREMAMLLPNMTRAPSDAKAFSFYLVA